MITTIVIVADMDEMGEPEQFTWDLFPCIDPTETTHLGSDGLPPPGTKIRPGMILVGKIGKTKDYDVSRGPSSLEIHGLPFHELQARYGHMWKATCRYADADLSGEVLKAYVEDLPQGRRAIVVIETEQQNRHSS